VARDGVESYVARATGSDAIGSFMHERLDRLERAASADAEQPAAG
jgi:hypothetical protein